MTGEDPASNLVATTRGRMAESTAAAALGDIHFQVKFINTAPGAPLPDLIQLFFAPEPGQEVRMLAIDAPSRSDVAVAGATLLRGTADSPESIHASEEELRRAGERPAQPVNRHSLPAVMRQRARLGAGCPR